MCLVVFLFCFQKHLDTNLDLYVSVLMKVAALVDSNNKKVVDTALKCTESLYRELFVWCKETQRTSEVNNSILVHLDLIKVKCL